MKTILITGSTDGIGLATANMLVSQGHTVLLHGRHPAKLADAAKTLAACREQGTSKPIWPTCHAWRTSRPWRRPWRSGTLDSTC